jgi:transcriptional regulator with XRE-family HTH domain
MAYSHVMRGADLIREARLRAGLTQAELSKLTGRERSVIARWEQGAVSPSFDNMLEVIEACGFELPLLLVPRETSLDDRLEKNRKLSPERRAQRLLAALDRHGEHDG